ncbi:fam-a protein [Plasmodium vinckei]|uniref:Fam-a protein n=1 Tax=Plasmodium vinckei TaxID=5860 RepID=A0A6V7SNX6_PLAVN|nr:fam-a protein [Plasmodium vinckei]
MKVMSVGLISLIIFNIVLAKNTSDSGSTTNSSLLLEEKTKKTHKTTEESVNVKGKGPYEEDYEENYGDMIKDIFMPLEDSYQYSRNNSHKQDDVPPPVSKGPKKQKFTEKRQLRAINENDKICQKLKDLLCTDPNEIINASKLMDEAVTQLEHHVTNNDGYEICKWDPCYFRTFSRKKHEDTIVQRITFQYFHSNKYNEIINLLWDPSLANDFNNGSVERKIVRVYNPNLVMIQQRYKNWYEGREKYFYALATKAQISEDATIIVMTSANIIDGYPSKKEYKNKIIKSANLFRTQINSEDDIRNKKLKKTFVNIAGYLLEKKGLYINITYLESIDGHTSNYQELPIKDALNNFFQYRNYRIDVYS